MKRILSYVLTVIMISAILVSVVNAADIFPDISGHWAEKEITYLAQKQILGGYPDGEFKPSGTVTRAEFIKMMTETFGLTETKDPSFSDVSTTDWFYQYIAKAAAQGFILSYGYSMSPNAELTREEAAALLARYLRLSDAVSSSYYPDYSSISSQYATYVLQATKAGLFGGDEGYFRPQRTLTRAEALTILYRAAGQIYKTSSTGKDIENLENAVITKAVTISDAYLEGNVYITEGTSGEKVVLNGVNINGTLFIRSSAEITFTNCTITNVVVESGISRMPTLKVYGNKQHIYNLSVGSPANIIFDSSAKVSEISVLKEAIGTKITGTGTIASLKIYTSGVTSEIVPANFTIDSTYTAVFGGVEYTKDGPVAVGTGFSKGYPYSSDETKDGYMTLTHKTEKTGAIYYTLVSKKSATPDAKTIKAGGYSIDITKVREGENELKLKYTKFDDSDLAVVFVDENGNAYEPVRVFSKESSGFYTSSVRASNSGSTYTATYTLNSLSAGKAYIVAYRPDDVTAPTDAKIVSYADGTTSSTKYIVGAVLDMPKAGTTYTYELDLPSSYSTYDWETAVIFETSEGVRLATSYADISTYKEDLTAKKPIEGNGFIDEPVLGSGIYSYPQVTSLYDVVSFKTKEDGKVYYYYTTTKTAPKAEDFYTNYRNSSHGDSINVTGGKSVDDKELYYTKSIVANYTYIVFSFCDTDGNYYDPVVLSRSTTTSSGFSATPTFMPSAGVEYALCTPLTSGTVYYYYTTSSSAPSATNFNTYYEGTTYRGYSSASTSTTYISLKNTADVPSLYTHIVLMLVDTYGNNYQPVVIQRSGTSGGSTSNGFTSNGYPSITSLAPGGEEFIIGTTSESSGTLYFFYTALTTAPSAASFESGFGVYSAPVSTSTVFASLGTTSALYPKATYPNVAIMFVGANGTKYAPVLLSRP